MGLGTCALYGAGYLCTVWDWVPVHCMGLGMRHATEVNMDTVKVYETFTHVHFELHVTSHLTSVYCWSIC